MADGSFRFRIGDFDCVVIDDGFLAGGRIPIHCLLVSTARGKILIDTGNGVRPQTQAGKLVANLQAAGVNPAEIHTVIHTHGDGDHIGGNTDEHGNIVFANARHIIQQSEWAYCQERALQPRSDQKGPPVAEIVRKNVLAFRERFDFLDGTGEFIPGITYDLAPGHTPGHMVITLSSGGAQLLCIGDLIHDPLEFERPDEYARFDFSHEQAINSRNRVLMQTASSRTMVWVCHFPFPGLGHIIRQGDAFNWQPLGAVGRKSE